MVNKKNNNWDEPRYLKKVIQAGSKPSEDNFGPEDVWVPGGGRELKPEDLFTHSADSDQVPVLLVVSSLIKGANPTIKPAELMGCPMRPASPQPLRSAARYRPAPPISRARMRNRVPGPLPYGPAQLRITIAATIKSHRIIPFYLRPAMDHKMALSTVPRDVPYGPATALSAKGGV